MKELLKKHSDATFNDIVNSIIPAFDYLENRLAGKCKSMYSLEQESAFGWLVFLILPLFPRTKPL
jgi:hypothetical protein